MKKLRITFLLFLASLACKPTAESQTVAPQQTTPTIPPTVSAARRTPVVVVAHNVLPAVVNIQTEATIRRRETDPMFDPFGFFRGRERAYTSQALGSGFVSSTDGNNVTKNHVIERASRITAHLQDRTQGPAEVIGVD